MWPENWPAFLMFCESMTQWRMGMSGPTGLDYGVLLYRGGLMDLHGIPRGERREMMDDIRVIERAALAQINEKESSA